jgi:hypothetical protein
MRKKGDLLESFPTNRIDVLRNFDPPRRCQLRQLSAPLFLPQFTRKIASVFAVKIAAIVTLNSTVFGLCRLRQPDNGVL